jgi:raffinose/stachyose/melibiose transport system permease protein
VTTVPVPTPTRALTARERARPRRRRALIAWAFLAPLLILNVLVVLGPSLATVYYSFTEWPGIGPAKFIGFANYTHAFTDPAVHQALIHNAIWFVLFLSVPMAMGLLGAHLLGQVKRFQMVFRALFFIPYIAASVVNAAVWKMLLSPDSGVGHLLGIDHAWLGDPNTSLYTVNFVVDWHWWGFLAVIFFAAMQGVDPQLYDAAKVDGANRWQQFKSVTIPGIRPTLVFVVLMTVIWSLKAFDYIFVMTHGGPANSSNVVSTLMYDEAFNQYSAGYAAALGLSMTVITGLVLTVYTYLRRKGWEE